MGFRTASASEPRLRRRFAHRSKRAFSWKATRIRTKCRLHRQHDNVAVPATPVMIDKFGACVGAFAPWQIEWVAILITV